MRISVVALALLKTVLGTNAMAEDNSKSNWWSEDLTVVDFQGLCNTKASKNPFTQFDAKAWRNEFELNCWWPVFEKRSHYFIKTYDWGLAPPQPLIPAPSFKPPSIDIWVKGLHTNDKSLPYRRSLTLYRFTCSRGAKRFAAIQFIAYDATDSIIEQWERPSTQMRPAIPDSKEEAFGAAVCN